MKKFLLFSILIILVFSFGCNEDLSTGSGRTNTSSGLVHKAIDIIHDGLGDENNVVKSMTIEIISVTGRKELMDDVVKLFKSDSVLVRFSAAVCVGDMAYSAGKSAAGRLLNDEDENVRIAAAYALVKLGYVGFNDMIGKSIKSKNQTVRANAAMLLGKIGDKKNLDALYWALRDEESNGNVKIQTIESIARLGDEWVYQKRLWPLLISKYADERIMGVRGMGALGNEDAKNAIVTMLSDESPEIRLCAAEELGRLGNLQGEAEVLDYFVNISGKLDAKSANRANGLAAMAIGRIGGNSLVRYLPKLLNSRSKRVRLSAAQAVLLLNRQ